MVDHAVARCADGDGSVRTLPRLRGPRRARGWRASRSLDVYRSAADRLSGGVLRGRADVDVRGQHPAHRRHGAVVRRELLLAVFGRAFAPAHLDRHRRGTGRHRGHRQQRCRASGLSRGRSRRAGDGRGAGGRTGRGQVPTRRQHDSVDGARQADIGPGSGTLGGALLDERYRLWSDDTPRSRAVTDRFWTAHARTALSAGAGGQPAHAAGDGSGAGSRLAASRRKTIECGAVRRCRGHIAALVGHAALGLRGVAGQTR